MAKAPTFTPAELAALDLIIAAAEEKGADPHKPILASRIDDIVIDAVTPFVRVHHVGVTDRPEQMKKLAAMKELVRSLEGVTTLQDLLDLRRKARAGTARAIKSNRPL